MGAISLALLLLATLVLPLFRTPMQIAIAADKQDKTLLLLVRDPDGQNVMAALLMPGRTLQQAQTMLIPVSMIIDSIPVKAIRNFNTELATTQTQQALSATTGLGIDGTLILDQLGLAALIDSVGGIRISQQRMDGLAAANYGGFVTDGEPEIARTERTLEIFNAFLPQLPAGHTQIKSLINLVGLSARSTIPTDDVVSILQRTSNALPFGAHISVMPTRGAHVDRIALAPYRAFAPLRDGKQVLVVNASGIPGLDLNARSVLANAGYTPVAETNRQPFIQDSVIEISDARLFAWASDLATTLGIPGSAVRVTDSRADGIKVVALIGRDFAPVRG